jgi:phi13 family phage major tail protein
MNPIIGLCDLVTAELTADTSSTLTYGTIESIEGLVDVGLEDSSADSEPKYADNVEKFRLYKSAKMKLVIEFLAIAQATLAKFYGHTFASGVLTKNDSDTPPYRAFGFKADDGAGEQDGEWLLKCIPVKRTTGSRTFHTKEGDNTTVQTIKVEFVCIPRVKDGEYEKTTNSGDAAMSSAWATWFDSVPSAATMYTVTYAAGVGGTGTAPTQASLYAGQTFITAENTFTKSGQTFVNWSDGTNTYDEGHAVTVGTANITLTAIWSA